MTSLPVSRNLTSIILAACCALSLATAQAQDYILTDLGVLPKETESSAAALNRQGQVTGTSGDSAFRYTDPEAAMVDIGNPMNGVSRGFAIDDSGRIVGDSTFGQGDFSHAAVFENGSTRDLAAFENAAAFSRGNGVNVYGQVVGFFRARANGEYGRAFITNSAAEVRRPSLTDLGTLGGMYAQALAINDAGFVTGNSELLGASSIRTPSATHAFIWNAEIGMVDLGTIGGDFSYGTGINSNNTVVGYSTTNRGDNRIHAFLYDGMKMRDLGSLYNATEAGDRSFALGVNSSDQVVGYSYVPLNDVADVYPPVESDVRQVAFIYNQGVMTDLNTLIGSAAKQYRLISATGINDKGQIVAVAFNESSQSLHAVLLTKSLDVPAVRPRRFSR
jgi:probable HAF family extracellular repeat protein